MRLVSLFFLFTFGFAAPCLAADLSVDEFWKQLSSCKDDKDCVSATKAWPACNHTCGSYKYDRCGPTDRVCPAYNLTTPIMAACAVNAPCREPRRIWCEKGQCSSE